MKSLLLIASFILLSGSHALAAPTDPEVRSLIRRSFQGTLHDDTRSDVEAYLSTPPGTPAISPWQFGNVLPDSTYRTLWAQEAELLKTQTLLCNSADGVYSRLHSYKDLHTPPVVESGINEDTGIYEIYYKYDPEGLGEPSGICILPLFFPGIGLIFIKADLVEYLLPTHKVNLSEQIFQSRYLRTTDVASAVISLANHLTTAGMPVEVPTVLREVHSVLPPTSIGVAIPPPVAIPYPLVTNPVPWAWLRSIRGTRGYSRHWGEPDINVNNAWYHPHFGRSEPPLIMDFETDPSFWLGHSRDIHASLYNQVLQNPQGCVRNNMADGKTPADLFRGTPGWTALDSNSNPRDFVNWQCLDNIGEILPYTAQLRRPHISDGFLQTLVKGLQIYQMKNPPTRRYSFRPDVDMIHFPKASLIGPLPEQINEKFVQDLNLSVNRCARLEDIAQENYTFDSVNIRELESPGFEGTVELYTRFRGCWGFKGRSFPLIIPTRPTRFLPTEIRVQ